MLIATQALLNSNPDPTEAQIRDAIGGNLCRCTGYQQIVEAVRLAAERIAKEGQMSALGASPQHFPSLDKEGWREAPGWFDRCRPTTPPPAAAPLLEGRGKHCAP